MANLAQWIVETDDLDELSVVNLKEGDTVSVAVDSLPDLDLTGTVISISGFGDKKFGAITYTTKIRLHERDDRLRWNMTASIKKQNMQ